MSETSNPLLLCLAPAPQDDLVGLAVDAERIGVRRLHLPADPRLEEWVQQLRSKTALVLTADSAVPGLDAFGTPTEEVTQGSVQFAVQRFAGDGGAQWFDILLGAGMSGTQVVLQAGVLATRIEHPITLAGDGAACWPAMLAGVAVGGHLRVGTAHSPGLTEERPDIALAAKAIGTARLVGRTAMTADGARDFLGLTPS